MLVQIGLQPPGEDGRPLENTMYFTLRHLLIEANIPVYQDAPAVEIKENGVYFMYNGNLAFAEADTVVLAVGSRSEKQLAEELKRLAPEMEVHEIGDCKEPRTARLATLEAAEIAHKL